MAEDEDFRIIAKKAYRFMQLLFGMFFVIAGFFVYYTIDPNFLAFNSETSTMVSIPVDEDEDRIENGIHVRTGLVEAEGLMAVVNNCTNCHSAKLVTQNRMNTERWNATIEWMQETQNLWDLGGNQEIIVNYLVTNYPPVEKGRREVLSNINWYELED